MSDEHFKTASDSPAVVPGGVESLPARDAIMSNGQALQRTQTGPVITSTGTMAPPSAEPKDGVREIVETVVFVIVLVLMLKTFVAEAFVIPTGSMATTLYGYHVRVICPQCDTVYTVGNKPEDQPPRRGVCPNCGFEKELTTPRPQGGQP